MKSLYVYIAGPYTKGDAYAAADQVWALGHVPFVSHLTQLWHLISSHGHEDWLRLGFAWIEKCDCLIRLPGDSAGADREVEHARLHCLPVFTSVAEFAAQMRHIATEAPA